MPESYDRGALTEATYLILLSLCEQRHGYGVIKQIGMVTNGRVTLGAGTLYGAVNLLLEKGWIEAAGSDERRKLYQITEAGLGALETEMLRLDELLSLGKKTLSRLVEGEENRCG
jgi:DNA-binding PadR family transcriptional regulator